MYAPSPIDINQQLMRVIMFMGHAFRTDEAPKALSPEAFRARSAAMYHFYSLSQSEFAGRDNTDVLVIYI